MQPEPVVMDGQRQRGTAEARQLSTMLAAAIDDASDIQIEPTGTGIRVRFRIDGVLHERLAPPSSSPTFIQAIKALSGRGGSRDEPAAGRAPAGVDPGPASDVSVTSLPTRVWSSSRTSQ